MKKITHSVIDVYQEWKNLSVYIFFTPGHYPWKEGFNWQMISESPIITARYSTE